MKLFPLIFVLPQEDMKDGLQGEGSLYNLEEIHWQQLSPEAVASQPSHTRRARTSLPLILRLSPWTEWDRGNLGGLSTHYHQWKASLQTVKGRHRN